MEEKKYYICLSCKKLKSGQFGKCYIFFDQDGSIVYDTLYKHTLKDIDLFLKENSKEQMIKKLKQDNVFYFINETTNPDDIDISIRYYDSGKERIQPTLSAECLNFDLESFFKNNLNEFQKQQIYNNLSGYLINQHTTEDMKKWIRMLKTETEEVLITKFQDLPYLEQRKIKSIIFEKLQESNPSIEMNKTDEYQYTRKKALEFSDEVA